jgi:hypothetical protein
VHGVFNRPKAEARRAHQLKPQLQAILDRYPDRAGIIIYPPTHDWGFMFQRPQQIARSFAKSGYLYFYCTNNQKTDTVIDFQEVEESLILCHVPYRVFEDLLSPIVYIGSTHLRETLAFFQKPFVIFDQYDDLEVSSGKPRDYRKLLSISHIMIVSSEKLYQEVVQKRKDVLLIPNGVDYGYIEGIRKREKLPVPQDLKAILAEGKPIIGYSGALAEWFDYDLLRELAHELFEDNFLLLGTSYDGSLERSGILSLPNVFWLGMKPYAELFNYVMRMDVGIIPFKVNSITLATSPIKLYEYAACLKPIVTTALPECKKYAEVLVAQDSLDFKSKIQTALTLRKDMEYLKSLDEMAKANSWDQRIDPIHRAVLDKLSGS